MFVSVVVITKNNAETVGEGIASLLDQTFPKDKYEILVVDGHSNDGTDEIVKKYAKGNSLLKLLYESHGTMGYARNVGVSASKGDIIAFTDGDAVTPKDWIEKIVRAFDDNQLTALGGFDVLVSSGKSGESTRIMDSWRRLKKTSGIKAIPCIKTVNFAIKRKALLSCGGFDPDLSHWDEAELMARLYSKTKNTGILYDPEIVVYHKHIRLSRPRGRIKNIFRRSVNGTAVLMRKHMIKVAIASPESTIGISFILVPFCISCILAVLLSIIAGFLTRILIVGLLIYVAALSIYVLNMFRRTHNFSLVIPLVLTTDFVVRLSGTFVGLIKWLLTFSKSKRGGKENCREER
jgi:glycosyltransferase involved in cell wall biosynthesis